MMKRPPSNEMLPTMYGELRRVARRYLGRERKNHTLQPTALVHEAWLRLQNERGGPWQGRTHGLALGAQAMRRLLVDHGRHQKRQKRGGGAHPVALDELLNAAATQRGARRRPDDARGGARASGGHRSAGRASRSRFAFSRACRAPKSPSISASRCERSRATGRTRARGSSASCQENLSRRRRGEVMARDKRLAELARSLHRASERLWTRVSAAGNYDISAADLENLQKINTSLNRAITKLKLKSKKA